MGNILKLVFLLLPFSAFASPQVEPYRNGFELKNFKRNATVKRHFKAFHPRAVEDPKTLMQLEGARYYEPGAMVYFFYEAPAPKSIVNQKVLFATPKGVSDSKVEGLKGVVSYGPSYGTKVHPRFDGRVLLTQKNALGFAILFRSSQESQVQARDLTPAEMDLIQKQLPENTYSSGIVFELENKRFAIVEGVFKMTGDRAAFVIELEKKQARQVSSLFYELEDGTIW